MSVEYNKGGITLTGPDGAKTYESVKADWGDSRLPDYTGTTTVIPSTIEQTLTTANTSLTSNIVVKAVTADIDSNIKAENIKKDVEILGVKGVLESGGGGSLKTLLDATKSCYYLFFVYTGTSVDDLISYNDTSKVMNMSGMFNACSNLTTIPQLDTSNVTNMGDMFGGCSSLTTIPQLDTSNVMNMNRMFSNCSNLTEIHMINIGVDLDIHWSTKMEREALLEVLGNLKDLTGSSSKTLTLGSTLLAKLTDEDKLIATNKNWVLK